MRNLLIATSYGVLGLFILFFVARSFSESLFFSRRERLNLVVLGKSTSYFSINKKGGTNYLLVFLPDSRILVPGGYGRYRVGALGKLVSLEKKPEILKRTFSSAVSTFTNFYFFPKATDTVYYGSKIKLQVALPGPIELFLYSSNAGLLDRIYIFIQFLTLKQNNFTVIKILPEEDFAKRYQGFFYEKTYRNEERSVQIVYTKKIKNAVLISRILEGSGIRVVDLTLSENDHNRCTVVEEATVHSQTSVFLASFFGCSLEMGQTQVSDIILKLGTREEEWAKE